MALLLKPGIEKYGTFLILTGIVSLKRDLASPSCRLSLIRLQKAWQQEKQKVPGL